jgi:hypothetical protein
MRLSNKPVSCALMICFLFCILSSVGYSDCNPRCGPCECCNNGNCESGCCDPDATCCGSGENRGCCPTSNPCLECVDGKCKGPCGDCQACLAGDCYDLCLAYACETCDGENGCVQCGGDANQACCYGAGCFDPGCEACVDHKKVDLCDPNFCLSCIDGQCEQCGGDANMACCSGHCYDTRTQGCCYGEKYDLDKHCCIDDELKPVCEDSPTFYCEEHNSDCGCDPLGWADCTGNIKEWTLGSAHRCESECGEPLNYTETEIACYAWIQCVFEDNHYDSICIGSGCEGTIIGLCQTCKQAGMAWVVTAEDCRCNQ